VDRTQSTIIIVTVIVFALALMGLGWAGRRRRQRDIAAPLAVPTAVTEVVVSVPVLYVATTRADTPLDRVAVHGLGFRAPGRIDVHADGVVLTISGRHPWFVPRADVRASGRATWAIDRVVEEGGLVVLAWRLGEADVDSYFRVTDPRAIEATAELLDALATVGASIPTTADSGSSDRDTDHAPDHSPEQPSTERPTP
jgi:hypothetical protein